MRSTGQIALRFGGAFLAMVAADKASADRLPPDLAKAAAAYDQAQIKGNRALFEQSLASDYRLVNSGGQVESRAQFIAESTAPGFRIDPFIVEEPIQTVWSNGAVLAGLVHITGADSGKPFDARLRFADIWAKRAGRWKVVFTEVTRVPPGK